MSYLGFGIQNTNTIRKPRQAFKPVFKQLFEGDHPIEQQQKSNSSWKEVNLHINNEQLREKARSGYIYLLFAIGVLTAIIFAMS